MFYCFDEREKLEMVFRKVKDVLPVIPTRDHMIQSAFDLDPWFPCHIGTNCTRLFKNRRIAGLTLFLTRYFNFLLIKNLVHQILGQFFLALRAMSNLVFLFLFILNVYC